MSHKHSLVAPKKENVLETYRVSTYVLPPSRSRDERSDLEKMQDTVAERAKAAVAKASQRTEASGEISSTAQQAEETAVAPTESPDEEGPETKRRREGTLVQSFQIKGSVKTELDFVAEPQVGGTIVEDTQEDLQSCHSFGSFGSFMTMGE